MRRFASRDLRSFRGKDSYIIMSGNTKENYYTSKEFFDKVLRYRRLEGTASEYMGIEITDVGPGWAKGELSYREYHVNPIGSVHGGVIFFLADSVGGTAASSRGSRVTTANGTISYLNAAMNPEKLIAEAEEELTYVDSVFDAVSRTSGESELLEIRQELSEQGYIKNYKNKNKLLKAQPPLKYRTSDGYLVWCGRNNKQNDKLTCRDARPWDIWFHTQGFAGSHVILVTEGTELNDLPDRTVEEAAAIAAWNSKARGAALIPVDYTQVKNVKKPNGAKPGMVIFDHYYTLYSTPDEEKVADMAEEK